MRNANGQRMGNGINGCLNLNNWNHLFNPNSQSALAGAEACLDHYSRRSGAPINIATIGPKNPKSKMVMYADGSTKELTGLPDMKPVLLLAALGLIIYAIWQA